MKVSPLSRWSKPWNSPASSESELDRGALGLDRLARLGQLDLLDALGGEDRDGLALKFVSHTYGLPGPAGSKRLPVGQVSQASHPASVTG